ncbi:YheC/YheD family protein [Paenibacillus protaetiae]|uniref:YheC/YheD family protein n=1 Tax=Paenibacillus protaetiae TaxID=2509456 RepID=A0A4P6EYS3_9BACL|nr:YheC/YheD family protein [Paenibacillus protaetiae]
MLPDDRELADLHSGKTVFAILTIDDDIQLFRGNRDNFVDIIKTGEQMGYIVYVLTVKNLHLKRSHLKGFAYNAETETWQQKLLPFPHIIYNRIPLREDEMQPAVRQKIKACMRTNRTILFNPSFFNKWELFEWLRSSRSTKSFIPATRRLMSITGLSRMLRRHRYLYLKPESGKAGKGIMTVKVQPEKQLPYRLKIQEDRKSVTYNCASLPKLWSKIAKESSGGAYIAQQGIQLASFQDRRFDLRALVQKNDLGEWDLTGIGARLAGSSSITTHVPRGGSIEDPEMLLVSSFNQDLGRKILIKAKQTALIIARHIEQNSGQTLGEMSMDLGVDKDGHIWFFEANAKPMKFDEPHIRQKSLERIFQYANYLTKGKKKKAGGA